MSGIVTDPFTNTDLAAVIPEKWVPMVNEAFFAKTVMANFVTDLSPYAVGGGDIFHVPGVYTNNFTVRTQSTQGAEVVTEGIAMDDNTLTVNTHKYIAILIGDKDLNQIASQYSISSIWAKKLAGQLADALEQSLTGLWSSISTNTIGDTATVVTDAEIRQAINKLDSTNYDLSECAFFFHPYIFWLQLHAIAKYYQQYSVGLVNQGGMVHTGNFNGNTAMAQALRGQLFGIPVYTTSNIISGLQTYRNLLLHKSAFAFAVQNKGAGKVRLQMEYQLRNLGVLTVADILYGVAVIREPGAVLINGSSAFIGS
jgi:hypothetical protein